MSALRQVRAPPGAATEFIPGVSELGLGFSK
jgi:hypothetical protein